METQTPQDILAAMLLQQTERKKNSKEVMVSRRKKAPVTATAGLDGTGGLMYNGQLFDEGALIGKTRQEAAVSMDGLPGELVRGRSAIRPEQAASGLEFDRKEKKWYRIVHGEKIYE